MYQRRPSRVIGNENTRTPRMISRSPERSFTVGHRGTACGSRLSHFRVTCGSARLVKDMTHGTTNGASRTS